MTLNYLNQSKERICMSLLNKVDVLDRTIIEAEELKDEDVLKSAYIRQMDLLQRLEKVLVVGDS